MTRRTEPPPSHLRLVFSADAASVSLLNDFASKMVEITNDIADRAVEAVQREVSPFGLELDEQALSAIRDPVLRTIAAGLRAHVVRVARGRDLDPDEDNPADDPDDDLRPYVGHTGGGLRERLRLILEPGDEQS
jgi:hypothetical protein